VSNTQFFEYLHHPATADLAEALDAVLAQRARAAGKACLTRPVPTRAAS
jgi:hypothetical protein